MKKETKQIIILLTSIVLIWGLFQFLVFLYFQNIEMTGVFGDSFGAINSLFTGFAFGGLIYTIHLQRKDLKIQKEELKQTRLEMKRSADAQEKSQKALTEQIKQMNLTAEIGALSALIEHYNNLLSGENLIHRGGDEYWKLFEAQKPHITRLEKLLDDFKTKSYDV